MMTKELLIYPSKEFQMRPVKIEVKNSRWVHKRGVPCPASCAMVNWSTLKVKYCILDEVLVALAVDSMRKFG